MDHLLTGEWDSHHINHNIINLCYEKFIEGYEVVCPSRFIKGGTMIGNPFLKGLLTRFASFFLGTKGCFE